MIKFSCIIPASKRDAESQNLKDLIASIRAQDFPQDEIEIIVITEGDSESAKAIGIRRAQGKICAMFCADNYLTEKTAFQDVHWIFTHIPKTVGVYSKHYRLVPKDNSLNRYFSLIGNNDPVAFYLDKCDRRPFWEADKDESWTALRFDDQIPSLGDNGFFYRKEFLNLAKIDNYYPMDVAKDIQDYGFSSYIRTAGSYIWHRTSDNLFTFLIKRYNYACKLYCDRDDRRWKIISTKADYWKLAAFIFYTLTFVQPLYVSIRGYLKVRDEAWFWHIAVCWGFLITYTILAIRNLIKHGALFQKSPSLSPRSAAITS